MTQEELITRAEELIAAWNAADVDRIVSAFCVDARERARLEAEAELERHPDLELEVLRTVAAGNVVTTEWVARSGRNGARQARCGVTVSDYDLTGRIARYVRYWEGDGSLEGGVSPG
jgi:hypothetical protein